MKSAIKGEQMKQSRRQYTKEFKQEAVRLAQQPGMRINQIARDLGINRTMLSSWIRKSLTEGGDAFRGHGNRKELEQENAVLKRRLRVLEEERDILKKAATWFAKESE